MDYYAILGVSETASMAEIRRAYRQLAVLYHPDKNPDPEAAEYFKVINAAYDVLGDEENRRAYDQQQSQSWAEIIETPLTKHRDPRYRPQKPGTRRKGQREKVREMMEYYLPYAKWIPRVALLLCGLLITDYLLPAKNTVEDVAAQHNHRARKRNGETYVDGVTIQTTGGSTFLVTIFQGDLFAVGDKISHRSSSLLSIPLDITPKSGGAIRILSTIYGYYFFFPTILLVLSGLTFVSRNNIEFQFNLAIACALVLPLTVIFLFVHHW